MRLRPAHHGVAMGTQRKGQAMHSRAWEEGGTTCSSASSEHRCRRVMAGRMTASTIPKGAAARGRAMRGASAAPSGPAGAAANRLSWAEKMSWRVPSAPLTAILALGHARLTSARRCCAQHAQQSGGRVGRVSACTAAGKLKVHATLTDADEMECR